ncbi:hypothetical protein M5D96_008096, partial [Drosophila gunungcola]
GSGKPFNLFCIFVSRHTYYWKCSCVIDLLYLLKIMLFNVINKMK